MSHQLFLICQLAERTHAHIVCLFFNLLELVFYNLFLSFFCTALCCLLDTTPLWQNWLILGLFQTVVHAVLTGMSTTFFYPQITVA